MKSSESPSVRKRLVWVIDGPLSGQLHKAARLRPASHLCSLGWDVTLVTSSMPDEPCDPRIRFMQAKWPHVYGLGVLLYHGRIALRLLSGALKADVVLFHENSALYLLPLVPVLRFTRARHTRMLMDTRSLIMDHDHFRGKVRALALRLSHWVAARLPLAQTCITPAMAEAVGVPSRKLVGVWPSGADPEEFEPARRNHRWPGPGDPIRLMYIGALHRERNLKAAMDAVVLARAEGVNVSLEIVGDGFQREELEGYARSLGNGAIKVSPPVPRGRVPEVLSRGDIGILPFPDRLEFRVSSAIKLFEYMAAGMPIMASRIEAHTHVLDGADFVFWIDGEEPRSIFSTIREVDGARSALEEMGRQSLAYSVNWTWEASARRLSAALDRVMAHGDATNG